MRNQICSPCGLFLSRQYRYLGLVIIRPFGGKRVESGQLLSEALELMVLGLGTVFVILTILVFVTATMSALVKKYAPVQPAGQSPTGTPAQPEDQTLLAVIAAAIHAHRNRR